MKEVCGDGKTHLEELERLSKNMVDDEGERDDSSIKWGNRV